MSRVGVGDRVRGLVGGFWMTWCVLFFACLFLEILLGRGGRVEVPVWERRMDALGLSRFRVQQGKSAKTSCLETEQNFGGKLYRGGITLLRSAVACTRKANIGTCRIITAFVVNCLS